MRKEDFAFNEPELDNQYTESLKEEIQRKGFAHEIDPNGDDVVFKYSLLPFRAYYSVNDARIAFINNKRAKIRLTSRNDISKDRASLESAITLMKFAYTIEKNSKKFLGNYQITYNPKLLHEETNWSMQYKDSEYHFIISTGAHIGSGEFELTDVSNKIVEISGILHSQIISFLKELQTKWPTELFQRTLEDLKLIALSNNALNM